MSVAGFGNVLNTTPHKRDIAFGIGTAHIHVARRSGTAENAISVTVKPQRQPYAYPTSFLALIAKRVGIAAAAIAINGVPKPICVSDCTRFSSTADRASIFMTCT